MTVGRVFAAVFGIIFAPAAIGLLVGGIALVIAFGTARDSDGFLNSPTYDMSSSGYAVTSTDIDLAPHPADWWPGDLATVRFNVAPTNDKAVFVGVGPSDDVERYLGNVARDRVTRLGLRPETVDYRSFAGTAPETPPGEQTFWVASSEGAGQQTLEWDPLRGNWTVVIMNADGSAAIAVTTEIGADIPLLLWIGIGMLIGAFLFGGLSAGLLTFAFSRGVHAMPATAAVMEDGSQLPPSSGFTVYPVMVEGRIDEPLSRWMWLIKWFLAIPHFIVLAFLWVAFVIMTILAFFAIVFTGRYPRAIFDFNVGVMRWAWRVVFYCSSVLATDRYPPFSLADDPNYPARLDVAYPERLSQGLVWVKWWLLAIPHYIIVGLFTSGLIWWTTNFGEGDRILDIGGGLIGVLALVAVVILLFAGRYPKPLFDLLMGLNRWVFRVAAYVALMRDEYPPFRLDIGGNEPPPAEAGQARQTPPSGGGAAQPTT
jgi:hypothetical protein